MKSIGEILEIGAKDKTRKTFTKAITKSANGNGVIKRILCEKKNPQFLRYFGL